MPPGTEKWFLAGFVAVLGVFAFVAYAAIDRPTPEFVPPPNVQAYSGPVSWRNQRDIYDRLDKPYACLPTNLEGTKRRLAHVNTARERLNVIVRAVQDLRELRFPSPPDMRFLRQSALARELLQLIDQEFDESRAAFDMKLLEALRAVAPGTDLLDLSRRAAGAAIAGFYDPDSKALFVGAGTGKVKVLDELTLAHELEHALADAALGLPLSGQVEPEQSDAQLAARALIEGDASLTAEQYGLALATLPRPVLNTSAVAAIQDLSADTPYFLQRSFSFPYFEGILFVCDLYAIGEWEAVDRAYKDPPTTTAEILFPSRYLFRIPSKDPTDPPSLPAPWQERPTYAFGAADLLWLFQAPGGQVETRRLREATMVRRWNGGELHSWSRGRELALALALVEGGEDSKGKRPSPTLCDRVRDWMRSAFPEARPVSGKGGGLRRIEGGYVGLGCTDEGPRFVLAPDSSTAAALMK